MSTVSSEVFFLRRWNLSTCRCIFTEVVKTKGLKNGEKDSLERPIAFNVEEEDTLGLSYASTLFKSSIE
jgi:hypothetical protein